MNIIILSPHFPYNQIQYCRALCDVGIKVLGIDHVPWDHLPEHLKNSLHDYCQVSHLTNYSELRNACCQFIQKHGSIYRIESHNEFWLETQANLASEFKISGLSNDKIAFVKRKSEMKKIFSRAALGPARGELATTLEAALAFAVKVGYPLMLKPDIGVGACGCYKIRNAFELQEFFSKKPYQDYLIEEFIHGDIWSFDGLTDSQGNLLFCTSHVYDAGIAEVVEQQLDQVYYSVRDIPNELEKIGMRTLAAFDVKERFFHFEYFLTHADKRWIPIEVNLRPPGGHTLDMCNYACDIDLYQKWARLMVNDIKTDYARKYFCMSISRRDQKKYLHSHEMVLHQGRDLIVHHNSVNPLFRSTLGEYVYIARSPDLSVLRDLQNFIHRGTV